MLENHVKYNNLKNLLAQVIVLTILHLGILNPIVSQTFDILGEKDERTIKFEQRGNFMLVKVRIKNTFELKFILDTGAENLILFEKSISDILGLQYTRRIPVMGSDLRFSQYALIVPQVPIYINGLLPFNINMLVLEENTAHLSPLVGDDIVGIIGADLLSEYNIEINYRRSEITFHRPGKELPFTEEYSSSPLIINRGKPYSLATIYNSPNDSADLRLLIDTGAGLSLLLHNNTNEHIVIPDSTITGIIGNSIGGRITGFLGRLHLFRWESYEFPAMLVNYQSMDSILLEFNSRSGKRNGIIGNKLLERFHVIINYQDSTLHLKPNKNFDTQFRYDRSGISFIASGPKLNKFLVTYIIPNSPADKAGVQVGDMITSVNYWPKFFFSQERLTEIFKGKEGKKIRLRVKRGGEKLTFKFRLRKMI